MSIMRSRNPGHRDQSDDAVLHRTSGGLPKLSWSRKETRGPPGFLRLEIRAQIV